MPEKVYIRAMPRRWAVVASRINRGLIQRSDTAYVHCFNRRPLSMRDHRIIACLLRAGLAEVAPGGRLRLLTQGVAGLLLHTVGSLTLAQAELVQAIGRGYQRIPAHAHPGTFAVLRRRHLVEHDGGEWVLTAFGHAARRAADLIDGLHAPPVAVR